MARGLVKGWLTGALLAMGLGASGCLAAHPHAYGDGYGYDPGYHAPVTVVRPHYYVVPPPRPRPAPPHWAPPPPPPRPHPPAGPHWRPESRQDHPPRHQPEPERRTTRDDRREHHPRSGERPPDQHR